MTFFASEPAAGFCCAQVAAQTGIGKETTYGILRRLEAGGWIDGAPGTDDPAPKEQARARRYRLSAKGASMPTMTDLRESA
jgi:DNA-binding IclR family transcriptional regulator